MPAIINLHPSDGNLKGFSLIALSLSGGSTCILLKYFHFYATLCFNFTTFQREIMHFQLHCIYCMFANLFDPLRGTEC